MSIEERMMTVEQKVERLDRLMSNLATKDDIETVVAILNAGTGIYKVIIGLGALSVAVTGIVIGFKQVILKVIS